MLQVVVCHVSRRQISPDTRYPCHVLILGIGNEAAWLLTVAVDARRYVDVRPPEWAACVMTTAEL